MPKDDEDVARRIALPWHGVPLYPRVQAGGSFLVMIGSRAVEGVSALTLATDAGLEAAFVPSAGMVGCSLRDHGEELLGQRGGLRHYIEQRSTMGIPLLHPWANRVARARFSVAGREVVLDSRRCLSPRAGGAAYPRLARGSGRMGGRQARGAGDGGVLAATLRLRRARRADGGVPLPASGCGGRRPWRAPAHDRHHDRRIG